MQRVVFSFLWLLLAAATTAGAACEPNIPADLSGDCYVDFNDFALMADDWEKPAVPHEWVERYNGSANVGDAAAAIAIDSSDNVYVTGTTDQNLFPDVSGDWATIKYDSDGNEIWVATFNGPNNIHDGASAIAIDSSDNIYVAGVTDDNYSSMTGGDWAVIKYDSDGNEIWVATFNGSDNVYDATTAMAIDNSDNIYVVGVTDYNHLSWTGGDWAVIKYDSDGNEIWVATFNGPGNIYDDAHAIAIDSSDNIYVAGLTDCRDPMLEGDYVTIKYDSDGNEVWIATYDGDANGFDGATDIAVDSRGNVYVTGVSKGLGTEMDCTTIKYDPNGNQVWIARYNGPANGYDQGEALAIDKSDNIYVTGNSEGSEGIRRDYVTIKYTPDSNEAVWVARYNGSANGHDIAVGIAIDSVENLYVTGYSDFALSDYDIDYVTIKYSPDSNQPVWVARYNGPSNDDDAARAIAVDSNDNIYVTGYSEGIGTFVDYTTIKYSADHTCTPEITGDFDHDCDVDIYDLRTFCQHWLECNLDPPEACWD